MSIACITIGFSGSRAQMCICTAVFLRTNDVDYYYTLRYKLFYDIDVLLRSVRAEF